MKFLIQAIVWLTVYVVLVLAPLLVLKFGDVPPGMGFWWDLSMALGFATLSMMGVQFVLTARFKYFSAPYGIDIVYFFHRYLAIIAFGLLLTHVVILYFYAPLSLQPWDPRSAPMHMTVGRIALGLFTLIIVTSLFRKPLKLHYERWRLWHIVFAISAFILSIGHVVGVGYYIEAPLKRLFWIAYSLFWLMLIVYIRVIKPWWLTRRPYRVVEVRPERGQVHTLVLAPEGHDGLQFQAGQFTWLSLSSPYALKEHPFSISSIPDQSGRMEFTIKELGDFTRTVQHVTPGTIAYVDGPYGNFTLRRFAQAPALVFIAGGVGIAPIMSLLRTLVAQRDQRPLLLLYGNENWERITFREELDQLVQRSQSNGQQNVQLNGRLNVIHILKQPPTEWRGETGLIDQALLHRYIHGQWLTAEYFICGPGAMRTNVEKSLSHLGVPLRQMHSEIFELV